MARLRPVSEDERATESPKTVADAAKVGDQRAALVAMRQRIAKEIDNPNTPARDLAALTKRYVEVDRDIEAIDARAAQDAAKSEAVADGEFDASAI